MRLKHLLIAVFAPWPVMFPASVNAWTITVTGTIYTDLLIGPSPLNGTGIFGTPGYRWSEADILKQSPLTHDKVLSYQQAQATSKEMEGRS